MYPLRSYNNLIQDQIYYIQNEWIHGYNPKNWMQK